MSTEITTPSASGSKRIASIDWMRGIVMVIMLIDHASMAFDRVGSDAGAALLCVPLVP